MRIVIVDDHRLFLDAMYRIVSDEYGGDAVITFDRADTALAYLGENQDVDLMLIDLSMPGMDGYSFLRALNDAGLLVPVVVVSATQSVMQVARAMKAGAIGFIPKTIGMSETLEAIRTVLTRGEYLSETMREAIAAVDSKVLEAEPALSPRQTEVLVMMAKGYSNHEIGEQLFISPTTVKSHVQAIMTELGATNRTQSVVRGIQLGLLDPSEAE